MNHGKLQYVVSSLALLLVFMIVFAVSHLFGPVKPVMANLLPTDVWRFGDNFAQTDLAGFKRRDCPIIGNSWRGMAIVNAQEVRGNIEFQFVDDGESFEWSKEEVAAIKADKEFIKISTEFGWTDDETDDSTFPPGSIYVGPARWSSSVIDSATMLGLELSWNCTGRTITQEFWFEMPLKEKREAY